MPFWKSPMFLWRAGLLVAFGLFLFLLPWPWGFPTAFERLHIGLPFLWLLGWAPWKRPKRLLIYLAIGLLPVAAYIVLRAFFWDSLLGAQIRPLPASERIIAGIFIESLFIISGAMTWLIRKGLQKVTRGAYGPARWVATSLLASYCTLVYGIGGGSILRLKIPATGECPFPHEDVTFKTSDNIQLVGWYIPSSSPEPAGYGIVFHCASGSRCNTIKEAQMLYDRGFALLLFDFRGHGDSQGHLCTLGPLETRDIQSAVQFFKSKEPGIGPGSIFVTGQSLGGIMSVMAGGLCPEVGWVAAHASYADLPSAGTDLCRHFLGPLTRPIVGPSWRLAQAVAGVDFRKNSPLGLVDRIAPDALLLSHGGRDFLIPYSHAERLIERAKEPKRLYPIPELSHMGSPYSDPEYEKELIAFIEASMAARKGNPKTP